MATATPHEDVEAYFVEGMDREPQENRIDCLPVPGDRPQGWLGVYAVLYTDTFNGEQICRDDLWMTTSKAVDLIQQAAYAEGRKDEAEERGDGPIQNGWQTSVAVGHAGYGVYAHMTEYPEEGAILLHKLPEAA